MIHKLLNFDKPWLENHWTVFPLHLGEGVAGGGGGYQKEDRYKFKKPIMIFFFFFFLPVYILQGWPDS